MCALYVAEPFKRRLQPLASVDIFLEHVGLPDDLPINITSEDINGNSITTSKLTQIKSHSGILLFVPQVLSYLRAFALAGSIPWNTLSPGFPPPAVCHTLGFSSTIISWSVPPVCFTERCVLITTVLPYFISSYNMLLFEILFLFCVCSLYLPLSISHQALAVGGQRLYLSVTGTLSSTQSVLHRYLLNEWISCLWHLNRRGDTTE